MLRTHQSTIEVLFAFLHLYRQTTVHLGSRIDNGSYLCLSIIYLTAYKQQSLLSNVYVQTGYIGLVLSAVGDCEAVGLFFAHMYMHSVMIIFVMFTFRSFPFTLQELLYVTCIQHVRVGRTWQIIAICLKFKTRLCWNCAALISIKLYVYIFTSIYY